MSDKLSLTTVTVFVMPKSFTKQSPGPPIPSVRRNFTDFNSFVTSSYTFFVILCIRQVKQTRSTMAEVIRNTKMESNNLAS